MIKAEKYDVSQHILRVRMICLFMTVLFIVFGVYAQCGNAVQFGGATASLAGFLLIVISYFHSRYSSICGLQYAAISNHFPETVSFDSGFKTNVEISEWCTPLIRNNFADFTLTRRP